MTKYLVMVRLHFVLFYYSKLFALFAEFGSEKFDQFLNLLGDKIRLRGWDKYRGGLDIKGNYYTFYKVI